FLAAAVGRAQVQQEPLAETSEGTGINITCSHPNLRTTDFIDWYRQLPGQGPTFLAFGDKGIKEVPDLSGRLWVAA
ncbi:TVA4 protein, partial [Psophia crepitans]|nr:TVA4 protein [Psophia crepitans]